MNLPKDFYQHSITEILRTKFSVSEDILLEEQWDKPLTGKPFCFSGVTMVYILLELEKAFEIRIPEHYLSFYGFTTLNQIADILYTCKSKPSLMK